MINEIIEEIQEKDGIFLTKGDCRYILSVPTQIGPGGIVTCTLIEESVLDWGGSLSLLPRGTG